MGAPPTQISWCSSTILVSSCELHWFQTTETGNLCVDLGRDCVCVFFLFSQKLSSGSLVIKVEPGYYEVAGITELYMRVHFDYNPRQDRLIPSQDAGLNFRKGDILKVLNQEDSFWWQAMRYGEHQTAGLVPSQMLEERSVALL